MSVNKKEPGTPAFDGPFWIDVVSANGWRIQYSQTLDKLSPLKPYRLVDPADILWASADTEVELAERLPELIVEYTAKEALFTKKEVKEALVEGLKLILAAAMKKQATPPH